MAKAKKAKSKVKAKSKKSTKKKVAKKVAKKATKKIAKKAVKKALKKATKRKAPARPAAKKTRAAAARTANTQAASLESSRVLLNVGDMAPDFSLQNQNGEMVTLSQYRGQNVVLYFYPKDDTPGCTREACSFRDNLSALEAHNAVVLGVSFDDHESHQKFISKYNLNFQLLCDLDKETAKAFGVYVQKNMYGNISWGIERSTFVIDKNGQISRLFRRVQVDGHTDEVLEALRAMAA